MPTVLMFKKIGGFHNALTHEVESMKRDGWEVVGEPEAKTEPADGSFDYAINKKGWKRVAKVCDTMKDALLYVEEKGWTMEDITIEERPRS